MNKPQPHPRLSANSSLATLKNASNNTLLATTHKQMPNKRFSCHTFAQHQPTSQKQNVKTNINRTTNQTCLNHPHSPAQYSALEKTDDPMYLCERCAILVASKGFAIAKISSAPYHTPSLQHPPLQQQIASTFHTIKSTKAQTMDKLAYAKLKLDQQQSQIEDYFLSLHKQLEIKKETLLQQIFLSKKELQAMKHQANNYYLSLLEKVKKVATQNSNLPNEVTSQFYYYLQEIARSSFKLSLDKIIQEIQLKPIPDLVKELQNIIFNSAKEVTLKEELNHKCEKEHSSIRSLQLSFEEDLHDDNQLDRISNEFSSNLLNSIAFL